MTHSCQLRIPLDTAELARARAELAEALLAGGFPADLVPRVLIAIDEALTNIIEHGQCTAGTIDIVCVVEPAQCTITIQDQGRAFDPRQAPAVDIQEHVAAGRSGGLGLHLMRRIMDVIDYHHEAGKGNRLTMIKHA
ncbi:MAG: ATP-binding protein [Planctomycetota bacterium]|nr:ATP-binding protein [Planctomycetota bacterium]